MTYDSNDPRHWMPGEAPEDAAAEPIPELALLRAPDDPARWNALAVRIVHAAQAELARRRQSGIIPAMVSWARPILVAAAVLLVAGALALRATPSAASTTSSVPTVVELLEVEEPAASWLAEDRHPAAGDLVPVIDEMPNAESAP